MSFLLAAVCWAQNFDIVTRSTPQPGVDQIRIDRPNPTKRSVDYRQITFQPDDDVTIAAGGCVQSGGTGSTWHRYVNPSGGDADKLYHGLITIPFATGSLERIQKYQNKRVHVAPNAQPGTLHLQLGFEDNNYSDNGYYRHDDGPDDQCKGATGGPAWVVLVVRHKVGSGPVTSGVRDWDLNVTKFDDNGIPLNPDWHHPFPNPDTCRWPWNDPSSEPDCVSTGQITNTDEHYTCEAWYHGSDHGLGGHANWTAATFSGQVYWDGHSNSVSDDDDYAMNVYTPGQAIATAGRIDGVHVEFSSDETVDVLVDEFKLPKWAALRKAVDDGDSAAQRFIGGSEIIVTGLLGVDFIHTPGAESHPAWAIAWHANSDFADDTWSFFVRGWGNEGYCSGDQHYISYLGNQYTFRFKWPAGATAGVVKSGTTFLTNASNVGAATVSFVPNEAVLLTFHDLPDPAVQGLVAGELHVSWTGTPSAPRASGGESRQPAAAPESLIDEELAGLTPAQRAIYTANAPAKTRAPEKPVVKMRWQPGPPPDKVRVNQHPQVRSAPDATAAAHKNAQIEALKKAGGKVPVPPHPQHHPPGLHPTPGAGSPPPATTGEEFPFNLVWDSLAPGGFPLNPRWKWQVDHEGSPNPSICHYFSNGDGDPSYADCTNQTHEENLPEDFNGWWCRAKNWVGEGFPGHLNWFASTYQGQASWTDSNADDDYNVALVSSGALGVMAGRVDLHTEFDADEMDIEDFVGPWWNAIYEDLFAGENATSRKDKFHLAYWINPDRGELFFARKVVLVEGETERALLNAFRIPYLVVHDEDPVTACPEPLPEDWNADKHREQQRTFALNATIAELIDPELGSVNVLSPKFENVAGVPRRQGEKKGKPIAALDHFVNTKVGDIPHLILQIIDAAYGTSSQDKFTK
ncbi:MAG: hypothetical protein DMG80_12150 [Acidobacteria bacterium]|nr:MAG: hypothetical protein DMG80_12150 [Acidobacteriota bacterium]